MRILAIDPGPKESAILRWIQGRIDAAEILPNDAIRQALAFYQPESLDVVAIEMVACFGMAVGREVFETCLFIGRLQERSPIEPRLVYRLQVKLHHCKSARAKDANIRQVLIDKYGAPGTKKAPGLTYGLKSHLWSAFAIATYVSETA
jgi:hypothetical protein